MKLQTNRPGIYSEYIISPLNIAKNISRNCAMLIFAPEYKSVIEPGRLREFYSFEELNKDISFDEDLKYLVRDTGKLLFKSGAKKLYVCIALNQKDLDKGLRDMEFYDDIDIELLCTYDDNVQMQFEEHLKKSALAHKERIGITIANNIYDAMEKAQNRSLERLIIVGQKSELTTTSYNAPMHQFSTAVALASAIAKKENPPKNLNSLHLDGILNFEPISDREIEKCLVSGVTPIEKIGGKVLTVKTLSTRSRKNEKGLTTFENISTIMTVDYVMKSIRQMLDGMLEGAKNNSTTKERISSQIIILMSEFVDREIINSFENPNVYWSKEDSSICIIEMRFNVASAINQICLTAQIIV